MKTTTYSQRIHAQRRSQTRVITVRAESGSAAPLTPFPRSIDEALRQAQKATQAALADGAQLLEVEFPPSGIQSVAGDGEGANEMTLSMDYLRTYVSIFNRDAATTRIFFPDYSELQVAKKGKGMDPNAGSKYIPPRFNDSPFKLDYLTKPTGLMDFGVDINKAKSAPANRVKEADKLFVVAYPHFSPGEMVAVEELYRAAAEKQGRPIIIFNGELDRIRSGYYPALFYPKIAKLGREFIPKFEQVYYIHNFKGSKAGTLFRCYPGPWQVERINRFYESATFKRITENVFQTVDIDQKGTISTAELWVALLLVYDGVNKRLPCHVSPPSRKEVEELLAAHDTNRDGVLQPDEFLSLAKEVFGNHESWKTSLAAKVVKAVIYQVAVVPLLGVGLKVVLGDVLAIKGVKRVPTTVIAGALGSTLGLTAALGV